MTSTKNKICTSINLSRKTHADMQTSGVKNVSRYVEGLIKKDLYDYNRQTEGDDAELKKLQAKLVQLGKDWEEYEKQEALELQRRKRAADKLPDPDPLPTMPSPRRGLYTTKKKKY